MATRGSYVHISMLVLCNFLRKLMGFEQKDSQGFENSYNSYEQYQLEKFFIFTIYQNYTLALIIPIYKIISVIIFFFFSCTTKSMWPNLVLSG